MSKAKLFAASLVWLLLLAAGVAIWKLMIVPSREADIARQNEVQQAEDQRRKKDLIRRSSSPSRYEHQIRLHLDSFSGYALLRSDYFRETLAAQKIGLDLVDDQADYAARYQALRDGESQMAVFPADALIKASAANRDLPATIVLLIDETTGADAILGYKRALPNINALNRPEARFVLTPDSPSDTLARVVMSRFLLDRMSANPMEAAQDAEQVYEIFKAADPDLPRAYVVWEPFVSKMLENPDVHILADSSRFPSTIVDCLVVNRNFLVKNEALVRQVVEAYLRTVYHYRREDALTKLVVDDARTQKLNLTAEQAARLVDGIWWKNTQENLAHFGLPAARRLPHIQDVLENLIQVLQGTGAIDGDPTQGRPQELVYRAIAESLKDFHPGSESESIRDVQLPELSNDQWEELLPVGDVRIEELVFARGTSRLTNRSQQLLNQLALQLQSTNYYVLVRGNAGQRGDLEANQKLAADRARVAEQYLIKAGTERHRIRAIPGEIGTSTSVTFELGQMAY